MRGKKRRNSYREEEDLYKTHQRDLSSTNRNIVIKKTCCLWVKFIPASYPEKTKRKETQKSVYNN